MATLVGQTVSHYKILEHLGGGGMGIVYKAQDLKLDRPVALKFLPPDLTRDPEAKQRFINEAKAASALQHTNICVVHDFDETPDSELFIVMEFLCGETLEKRIKRGPLKVAEAIDIAIQTGEGLATAHKHRIIHRDIKPANIVVTDEGVAKIVDFGLAKLSSRTRLTRAGSTLGTSAYMSPEQARGEPVDERTDIWSLGITLYESIAGRTPFEGDYDSAVIHNVLNEEPKPLSSFRNDVPPPVEQTIAVALEKEPEKRFQTIQDLLLHLRSAFAGEMSSAGAKSIAVLPFANMSADPEQEYFCDGLAEEIINSLSQLDELHVVARTSSFAFKDQRIDIREIGRKLNVRYVLEGSVRTGGGKLRITAQLINVSDGYHLWSERYDRTMHDLFAIQDETTMKIVGKLKVKLGSKQRSLLERRYTDDLESYTLCLKGRYYWSAYTEEGFKKGIQCFEQAIAHDPNNAPAYSGIAICNTFLGYYLYLNPKEEFEKAEAAAQKALQLDGSLAEAHLALAWVKMSRDRDWCGSEAHFNRAIELSPGYAIAHGYYAALLSVLGKYQEAIAEAEKAFALDPLSPLCGSTTGLRYYYARQYDRSIDILKKTLEMDPRFAPGYWMLSLPLAAAGRIDEAITAVDKTLELLPEPDPLCLSIRGIIYALSPHKEDARRVIKQLLELSEHRPIPSFFMGMIHIGLGEKDQVFAWFEKAFVEHEPLLMWARPDPIVQDGLQTDPRYHDLLRRMGLGE